MIRPPAVACQVFYSLARRAQGCQLGGKDPCGRSGVLGVPAFEGPLRQRGRIRPGGCDGQTDPALLIFLDDTKSKGDPRKLSDPLSYQIYQGHRKNTPFIHIGRKRNSRRIRPPKEVNAIKQALAYRELLDTEQAHSQGELARLSGIPRPTVTAYLRLLRLDDDDERLLRLTEARLRPLVGKDKRTQRQGLKRLVEAS